MVYFVGFIALMLGMFCYAAFYGKSTIFAKMPWHVETDKKIIALTFNDGPNRPFTEQIAEIIEAYGGRATFFVVGQNCERIPGVIKELQERGHQIGAHSYHHQFHRYITDPLYKNEILRTKNVLNKQGIETDLFRFPWLFRTPWLVKSVIRSGYRMPISGVFSHPFEPLQIQANAIAKQTLKKVKSGTIIIFHDGYNAKPAKRFETVDAVRQVTKVLHAQGYKFVTVDELMLLG